MSLWDTHRTQAPWLTLTYPSVSRDVTLSLVRISADGGKLPRWPLGEFSAFFDFSPSVQLPSLPLSLVQQMFTLAVWWGPMA